MVSANLFGCQNTLRKAPYTTACSTRNPPPGCLYKQTAASIPHKSLVSTANSLKRRQLPMIFHYSKRIDLYLQSNLTKSSLLCSSEFEHRATHFSCLVFANYQCLCVPLLIHSFTLSLVIPVAGNEYGITNVSSQGRVNITVIPPNKLGYRGPLSPPAAPYSHRTQSTGSSANSTPVYTTHHQRFYSSEGSSTSSPRSPPLQHLATDASLNNVTHQHTITSHRTSSNKGGQLSTKPAPTGD